jgi:CheY-like chemotaxis protein
MSDGRGTLAGQRILVVEDEFLIAADLARSLKGLGAAVIGPAGSVRAALALLEKEAAIDAAVLDINLTREKVYPVAQALQLRQVPFVFATGYEQWVIPREYETVPRCEKPVDLRALISLLSL